MNDKLFKTDSAGKMTEKFLALKKYISLTTFSGFQVPGSFANFLQLHQRGPTEPRGDRLR